MVHLDTAQLQGSGHTCGSGVSEWSGIHCGPEGYPEGPKMYQTLGLERYSGEPEKHQDTGYLWIPLWSTQIPLWSIWIPNGLPGWPRGYPEGPEVSRWTRGIFRWTREE